MWPILVHCPFAFCHLSHNNGYTSSAFPCHLSSVFYAGLTLLADFPCYGGQNCTSVLFHMRTSCGFTMCAVINLPLHEGNTRYDSSKSFSRTSFLGVSWKWYMSFYCPERSSSREYNIKAYYTLFKIHLGLRASVALCACIALKA